MTCSTCTNSINTGEDCVIEPTGHDNSILYPVHRPKYRFHHAKCVAKNPKLNQLAVTVYNDLKVKTNRKKGKK